jgi:hypothetical protein
VSPRSRCTTAAFLACVALTACQGAPSTAPPSAATESPGTAAVAPRSPRFAGRLTVQLQPALMAVGETACTSAHNRICSTDGTQGWVPIKEPRKATLLRASTRLTDEHTSWMTVLRFAEASRHARATAAADAAAAGGVVLLMRGQRAVTALTPLELDGDQASGQPSDRASNRLTLTGQTKQEAWDLVTAVQPPEAP